MTGDRYVLLGLAPTRSEWFSHMTQWAASAALAAEFIKCLSAEEVRARLSSGRRHSALVIDSSSPAFDRDLVGAAVAASTPVILVRDRRSTQIAASDVGVVAELEPEFRLDDLLDVLAAHCETIGRGDQLPPGLSQSGSPLWLGQLYTVCGPGGTGASTVAIALAQGLGADARLARRVLLADLARRGDQAMLHDAGELGPGVQELVEAHRLRRPDLADIVSQTFDVPRRNYRLLLGLRRPEAWSALRPRAVDASIEGVRRAFQVVVADVTGDFEGETDGGSADVEERNHLARSAALQSSVVVAVGAPGMKGVHSLASTARNLIGIGVRPERIIPVINRAPRSPAARASLARGLAGLLGENAGVGLASPVHLPERKLEDALRDGAPLPAALVHPIVKAVSAVADRQADGAPALFAPVAITPGSLGSWTEIAESDI